MEKVQPISVKITAEEARNTCNTSKAFIESIYNEIRRVAASGYVSTCYYVHNISTVLLKAAVKELEAAGFKVAYRSEAADNSITDLFISW